MFLPLQPGQQLPGMRLVQLFHLLNDHLNCAHVGSVALVRNVATSAIGKVSVSPGGRGVHSEAFSHYEEMPREAEQKVVEESKRAKQAQQAE